MLRQGGGALAEKRWQRRILSPALSDLERLCFIPLSVSRSRPGRQPNGRAQLAE